MVDEGQIDKARPAQEDLYASMQEPVLPPRKPAQDTELGSIAGYVITLGLSFLVTMATLLTVYLSDTRQENRFVTGQSLENSAREAELALTRFADHLERAAVAVEYGTPAPGTAPPGTEYSPLLQRIMKREASLVSVVVSDRAGLIHHASLPQMVGTQFEYSEMAMDELRSDRSRRAVLVGPVRSSLGRMVVMYVHALHTPDRSIRGMVILTFPTHAFTTLLAPLRPDHPSGKLTLLDSGLTILAQLPDRDADAVGSSKADFTQLAQFAASDKLEALLETMGSSGGQDSLMIAAHKTSVLDLTILVEMSESDGLASWRLRAFGLSFLFSTVGIMLTVLVIFILRRSLAWRQQNREMGRNIQVFLKAEEIGDMGSWTAMEDGTIKWSDTACRILGYREGNTGSLEMAVGSHGTETEILAEAISAAGRGAPLDLVYRSHNGSRELWLHIKAELAFDEQGKPVNGTGIIQDITWIRSSEEKARATAHRFREILENLPVPVWWSSHEKGRKHFNHAWTVLTGMRPDPLNPDEWMAAIHPEDRRATRSLLQIAFEKHEPSSIRFRLRNVDGSYILMACSLTPFSAEEGDEKERRGIIAVCMEDRKVQQKELSTAPSIPQKQETKPPSTKST